MPAIFFGSVNTLVETCVWQRAAFNEAFRQFGLDWHWNNADYSDLLHASCDRARIECHALNLGVTVEAESIANRQAEIFIHWMREQTLPPRPGVRETLNALADTIRDIRIAIVTNESAAKVKAVLRACGSRLRRSDFDLILDGDHVARGKPWPDVYHVALDRLELEVDNVVAIEDSVEGIVSANAAGLSSIAFPGPSTESHNFASANRRVHRIDPDLVQELFMDPATAVVT